MDEEAGWFRAARCNDTEYILKHIYMSTRRLLNGQTALMIASQFGNLECVRLLLHEAGRQSDDRHTALIKCIYDYNRPRTQCHVEIARLLFSEINIDCTEHFEANNNVSSSTKYPIHYAIQNGYNEVNRELVQTVLEMDLSCNVVRALTLKPTSIVLDQWRAKYSRILINQINRRFKNVYTETLHRILVNIITSILRAYIVNFFMFQAHSRIDSLVAEFCLNCPQGSECIDSSPLDIRLFRSLGRICDIFSSHIADSVDKLLTALQRHLLSVSIDDMLSFIHPFALLLPDTEYSERPQRALLCFLASAARNYDTPCSENVVRTYLSIDVEGMLTASERAFIEFTLGALFE